MSVELICVDCIKRGKCAEPCEKWYKALEKQLTEEVEK